MRNTQSAAERFSPSWEGPGRAEPVLVRLGVSHQNHQKLSDPCSDVRQDLLGDDLEPLDIVQVQALDHDLLDAGRAKRVDLLDHLGW